MKRKLAILCDTKAGLRRVEVPVHDLIEINGIPCFVHVDIPFFVISHIESGGRISSEIIESDAIHDAHKKLADLESFNKKIIKVKDEILNAGHIYPLNAIPA